MDRTSDTVRGFTDQRAPGRRGFTLLEVVVALGLSVILLAAVSGAISLSYQVSTAGRDQMEHAQLVRALFQKIDSDIRSVCFAVLEDVEGDSGQPAAEEDEIVPLEGMSPDEALTGATSGVFGTVDNLVLHISRPERRIGSSSTTSDSERIGRGDSAAVSYFLAVRGSGGLPGLVADRAYQGSLLNAPQRGTVSGLARFEGEHLTLQMASADGGLEALAPMAQLLAPEVLSLSFAYWDGVEWSDSWDTLANGRLPVAIEITVEIDPSRNEQRESDRRLVERTRSGSQSESTRPISLRHVVTLPLAEPASGGLAP